MIRLVVPEIGEEEIQAVISVLRSGYLVQGEYVQEFERLVAEYVGVKHGVAVSSGTAALHLGLLALGIGPGDEVIVPDFTFPATANVVELVGAKPVLIDIDIATFNLDVNQIRAAITPRTKAILPVHLFGQPADMEPILEIARDNGFFVLEDAACALGAEYRGRKCGAFGHAGCFSFHPRKAITTGEGGMVVTDDDSVAERVRQLRNHGMSTTKEGNRFSLAGFNYRMTDFQGALGAVQMRRLEGILERRVELARLYHNALAGIASIIRPRAMDGVRHIWQSYVILLREGLDQGKVIRSLKERGVEATIGTYAISIQPHYSAASKVLTKSHKAYKYSISLPLYSRMSVADIDRIGICLAESVGEGDRVW